MTEQVHIPAMLAIIAACLAAGIADPAHAAPAGESEAIGVPAPERPVAAAIAPRGERLSIEGPAWSDGGPPVPVDSPAPPGTGEALPINLATALYLSDARPLIVAIAQTGVESAAAELRQDEVLWLPDLHFGAGYYHQDGLIQATDGTVFPATWSNVGLGGGATLNFGVTDAIFRPLAAKQVLAARQWDVQTARNDALLAVAAAYFDVEQARGRLAGARDTVAKAQELARRVDSLARDLVPAVEVDRARAELADLQQAAVGARRTGGLPGARLTRVLRLNPSAIVVPLEPPHLRITVIPTGYMVNDLIPVGLRNRPELASQRSLVEATLELLRQERVRPLLPSVVLQGGGPNGVIEGGMFAGGLGGNLNTSGGRFEGGIGLVWTLNSLGMGNRALVRQRAADQQRALLELLRRPGSCGRRRGAGLRPGGSGRRAGPPGGNGAERGGRHVPRQPDRDRPDPTGRRRERADHPAPGGCRRVAGTQPGV